jgi:hypothetical protein
VIENKVNVAKNNILRFKNLKSLGKNTNINVKISKKE